MLSFNFHAGGDSLVLRPAVPRLYINVSRRRGEKFGLLPIIFVHGCEIKFESGQGMRLGGGHKVVYNMDQFF